MTITPEKDLSGLKIDERARSDNRIGGRKLALFSATFGALVVLTGLVFAFRGHAPAVEVAAAQSPAEGGGSAVLNASGYVTPRRRATVAAKITGRVDQIYAEEGLRVRAGQVLATLDCSETNAQLLSARADRDATAAGLADLQVNSKNADVVLKRTQALVAQGVSSEAELDNARTAADSYRARIALTQQQVNAAEARISVIQRDVDNCTVRAPFDGIIVSKDAQKGEMVSPVSAGGGFTRTGIATIVDMNSIEVEVDVNEDYIARVTPGQKVLSTLDAYPDWHIPSKVRTVIPTADRQKATVKVRISFDQLDPRILPDMGVKVAFLSEEPSDKKAPAARALVPAAALRQENGQAVAYIVRDGKLERRAVTAGADRGDQVEILAGLEPGDSVVVKGSADLRDGEAVDVRAP